MFDILIRNNENLITALGGSTVVLHDVLEDFTKKLTKKFANVDTWSKDVGTWATSVGTHTHPPVSTTVVGVGGAPPGPVTGTGIGAGPVAPPVPPISPLIPLKPATRFIQINATSTNPSNINGSQLELVIARTGPLGDGSPITAEDTQATLDWLNNMVEDTMRALARIERL
jgi:hypothetical protein